jgi:hypothetical protein
MCVYEAIPINRGSGNEKKREENVNNKNEHKEKQTFGMIKPAHLFCCFFPFPFV